MSMHLRRAVTSVAALTLAATLAGCGGSSSDSSATGGSSSTSSPAKKPGAGTVYKQARQTALAAKNGHVSGTVTDSGTQTSIDLLGTADGSNQKVTFRAASEGTFTLLTVAGKNWVQGDKTFWTANADAATATRLDGKWVVVPDEQAKDFGDTNLKGLLSDMFDNKSLSTLESLATAVNETEVGGVQAYVLQDKGSDDGQVFVTADGSAHLIKIVGPKDQPGTLTFSQWDAVKPFTAPAAGDIVSP